MEFTVDFMETRHVNYRLDQFLTAHDMLAVPPCKMRGTGKTMVPVGPIPRMQDILQQRLDGPRIICCPQLLQGFDLIVGQVQAESRLGSLVMADFVIVITSQ